MLLLGRSNAFTFLGLILYVGQLIIFNGLSQITIL